MKTKTLTYESMMAEARLKEVTCLDEESIKTSLGPASLPLGVSQKEWDEYTEAIVKQTKHRIQMAESGPFPAHPTRPPTFFQKLRRWLRIN